MSNFSVKKIIYQSKNKSNFIFLSQSKLVLISAFILTAFYNISFFSNVIRTYETSLHSFSFISLCALLLVFTALILRIICSKYTIKPLLIAIFIVSSFAAYFMDSYHVVIDDVMIRNIVETDINESIDLLNVKLIAYVFFLGIIPSLCIYKTHIIVNSFKSELWTQIKFIFLCVIFILAILLSFSRFYSSFFREYKSLRFYSNPTYWIYSIGYFVADVSQTDVVNMKEIGNDARINESLEANRKRKLIIMVVGETARADRFSLNGYEKETNPNIKKEANNIINFNNMYSCGTSTSVSVPCMFSILDRKEYNHQSGYFTHNVLDVLSRTNEIAVLWRDNNSDSKGVALRVDYEDYKTSKNNIICDDSECRDEGMLVGLDQYIQNNTGKDILIVLHQMGNHGPAYYKRYPKEFEIFTPVCKTNQLDQCTKEEVGNAYDNAILYTDYFLSKTINFLKSYSNSYSTAMFYVSDHGESLGENNLYLHGLPYFMAPENQKNVASLMWLGSIKEDIDMEKLQSNKNKILSHDNIFDTLLGLFDINSSIYDKNQDIINMP